jgi:hypothetical protein
MGTVNAVSVHDRLQDKRPDQRVVAPPRSAGGVLRPADAADLLGEMPEAIRRLSAVPSARLERLLAEPLDLCSRRLDV